MGGALQLPYGRPCPPLSHFLFSSCGLSLKLRRPVLPSPAGMPPPCRLPASPLFGTFPSSAHLFHPLRVSGRVQSGSNTLLGVRGEQNKRATRPCVNSRGARLSFPVLSRGCGPDPQLGGQHLCRAFRILSDGADRSPADLGLPRWGGDQTPDMGLNAAEGSLAEPRPPARHVQWGRGLGAGHGLESGGRDSPPGRPEGSLRLGWSSADWGLQLERPALQHRGVARGTASGPTPVRAPCPPSVLRNLQSTSS